MVQVDDLQHSGLQLLKRSLAVERVCEAVATRVVLQPGHAQPWSKGGHIYLSYYQACASGWIPSLKFSTGVQVATL